MASLAEPTLEVNLPTRTALSPAQLILLLSAPWAPLARGRAACLEPSLNSCGFQASPISQRWLRGALLY